MDFINDQASESDNDSSASTSVDSDADQPKAKRIKKEKKLKKKKTKKAVDSSDDDDDNDDDDDEERAKEEMKGFIADEEEEEPEEDDNKSEKSKEDEESELDEDDLALIDENLDISGNKKPHRVILSDSDDDAEDDRTKIGHKLFSGSDNDEGPSHRGGRDDYDDTRDGYSDSEQSEDNFIVNESGDRPTHRHHRRKDMNVPEGALDEARDIFGVEDFNLDDFYDEDEEGIEDEEDDIMEDEGEEGAERVRRVRGAKEKKSTLLDTMEPSELERGFLAPMDKKIQLEDRPERFQLRPTPVTEAHGDELEQEARWIYTHAFNENTVSQQGSNQLTFLAQLGETQKADAEVEVVDTIKEALNFIRNQLFEVPFIAFYRKEAVAHVLSINDLWKVYVYDEKWCHLQKRKTKLIELMKRMQTYQIDGDSTPRRPITEKDLHDVYGVESAEQLADATAQFQLFYGNEVAKMQDWERSRAAEDDENAMPGTHFKQCSRSDRYQLCVDCGIGEMVGRYGLTAREFAENLDWKKNEIEQDSVPVQQAAEEYISTSFPDPEAVIAGSVFMMAKEISRQPSVRDRVRRLYRRRVTLSARLTKLGREQIDDSHPMWHKRYIKDKEISAVEGEEYLYYMQMKAAGTMEVSLTCDKEDEKASNTTLFDSIVSEGPFRKDEFSDLVEGWNDVRDKAVRMAINEMLIPYFEQEIHQKLLEEAKNCVIKKCAEKLASRLETAAFKPNEEDIEDEDEEFTRMGDVRIMAIAYSTEYDEASFGAVVDQDGSVLDYVRLMHFIKRGHGEGPQAQLKKQSMALFKQMVNRKRPHAIALAAESMDATRLKKDLDDAIFDLVTESVLRRPIPVYLVDNEAAKIYMHSKTALLEYPDYPPTLRQAVSLGRILLDPLTEYAHLWNFDEDIFCLALHPLKAEVPKEQLSMALAREMINKVNEVGVDVNKCLEYSNTANLLQFVAGLGPRKSAHLLKTIKQADNLLESRTKLVTACHMGPKVFMNCAGFIRIDTEKVADRTDLYVEVLDGSRVHPETYEWARKMAVDALEVDDNADPTAALEEILQSPDRLKDLDLDAFADELKRQGFGDKKNTLYDISFELNHRYKDLRKPFTEMPAEDLFTLLTKSSKDFAVGKRMAGVVIGVQYRKLTEEEKQNPGDSSSDFSSMWSCQYCHAQFANTTDLWAHLESNDPRSGGCPGNAVGIRVRLDNGITGFVPNKMLSDNPKSFKNPLERVKINQPLYCRIVKFDPEKFSCLLSTRTSDLTREDDNEKDKFWDYEAEAQDIEHDKEMKQKKKMANTEGGHMKRVIQHPNFYNVTYSDAVRQLNKLEQGDAVIRPSSKRDDHLTVTWKVAEGIFVNIDVKEEEKEQPFSLGKKLYIEGEEFDDLNEILARWVQPMAVNARDILQHKYFLDGVYAEERDIVENKLREEKARAPTRTPYVFTPCATQYAGKFMISYLASSKCRHEYMTPTAYGIRFRKQMFDSLPRLIDWFKVHYREPPPGAVPMAHAYRR